MVNLPRVLGSCFSRTLLVASLVSALAEGNTLGQKCDACDTGNLCRPSEGVGCSLAAAGDPSFLASRGDTFFTSLDGAGGIARFFMNISDSYPEFDDDWQGALRWLDAVAETVETAGGRGYRWRLGLGDYPATYPVSNAAYIGKRYLEGYERTGDAVYLDHVLGAMRYLVSLAVPEGGGVKWPLVQGQPGVTVWFLTGDAAIAQYMLDVYLVTGSPLARSYAEAGARWLIYVAQPHTVGYSWLEMAYTGDQEAGWCHGAAGIAEFFYNMYEALGDPSYLVYANGALDWLTTVAVPEAGGFKWPLYHHSGSIWYSSGDGGGASGIGRMFLRGYRITGNPAYMTYAQGAANWLIAMAEPTAGGGYKWLDEYTTGRNLTCYCQGYSGIAIFFTRMWEQTRDPVCRDHAVGLGIWLDSLKVVDVGGYAWPKTEIWHAYWPSWLGTAGIATIFLHLGQTFAIPEFIQKARGGAYWLRGIAVADLGGTKWPYHAHLTSPGPTGGGGESTSPSDELSSELSFRVDPNPLSTTTDLAFHIPPALEGEDIGIRTCDTTGRELWSSRLGPAQAGSQHISWPPRERMGQRLPPGVYLVTLQAGPHAITRKAVLVR